MKKERRDKGGGKDEKGMKGMGEMKKKKYSVITMQGQFVVCLCKEVLLSFFLYSLCCLFTRPIRRIHPVYF